MTAEERLHELIADRSALRLIEPNIYSLSSTRAHANTYDRIFGTVYDVVACNRLYNRFVWGYRVAQYHALCLEALGSSSDWMLDAGCGSLAFTARAYLSSRQRPVVLLDQSLNLLRMARERMRRMNGRVPENMVFLHGDVLRLPFQPGSFDSILSLNLLHVLEDPAQALRELKKALTVTGTIWCTTLIRSGRFADRYLDRLGASKLLVPRNADQLTALFDEAELDHTKTVSGNLAAIRANGRRESFKSRAHQGAP